MVNPIFNNDIPADLVFSPGQSERISKLGEADIERIDATLLSFASERRPRRVARVVMSAMEELKVSIPNVGDTFYILRVRELIIRGDLVQDNDFFSWRECEIRLPPQK